MNPGWMGVKGEGGFEAYVRGLEEDERVRRWWDVACEKHRAVVEELGGVRGRMKSEAAKIGGAI